MREQSVEVATEQETKQAGYAARWKARGCLALGLGVYQIFLDLCAMPDYHELQQRGLPQVEAAGVVGAIWLGLALLLPALPAFPAAHYRRLIGRNEHPRFQEEVFFCWGGMLLMVFGLPQVRLVLEIAAHQLALAALPQLLN